MSAAIADSFSFPFDNPTTIIGYDIHPSFSQNSCFGVDIRDTWHAGEDWFAPAGTTVRAVAQGIVKYVHPIERDYPGRSFAPELDKDKVKIEIYTSSKTYDSLETFAAEQEKISEEIRGEPVDRDYETILVDDQRALKTISDFPVGAKTLIIYVQNPSTKLMHTFVAMPRYDLHTKVVDQILSTFKFIEAIPSATIIP